MSAPVADTAEVPAVRSGTPVRLSDAARGIGVPPPLPIMADPVEALVGVPVVAPASVGVSMPVAIPEVGVPSRRSTLSARRRARRERRQLAALSLLALAMLLGATIIILDMVR